MVGFLWIVAVRTWSLRNVVMRALVDKECACGSALDCNTNGEDPRSGRPQTREQKWHVLGSVRRRLVRGHDVSGVATSELRGGIILKDEPDGQVCRSVRIGASEATHLEEDIDELVGD